jgi:hypothetical protein
MTVAVTQGLLTAARLGMVEVKGQPAPVEFKPDTLLAKAETEVKQQLDVPNGPPASEPLKWPGVSDLREAGEVEGVESDEELGEHRHHEGPGELPPTESTGPGEEAEPPSDVDVAPGALSRTSPPSR